MILDYSIIRGSIAYEGPVQYYRASEEQKRVLRKLECAALAIAEQREQKQSVKEQSGSK